MKSRYYTYFLFVILGIGLMTSCYSKKTTTKPAKYIFFIIGDGMGLAQISAAEAYLSEKEGKVGGVSLPFTQFPATGFATTYSANKGITCSSAAGTALATGTKTKNGMLGMNSDTIALKSIASKLKEAGYKIGITTSVGVNHATPAAFYGHQDNRDNYYEIGLELPVSGFDFFAGASMLDYKGKAKDQKSLYDIIAEGGYGVARGVNQYDSVSNISKKILWVENPDTLDALTNRIDRKGGELTLPIIVDKAISFLSKDADKGFFLMIEGGKIDWSSHANDGASAIQEVLDLSAAIDKVVEFYNAHPDETLIVITADHETGGMALAHKSGYNLNTKAFDSQKASVEVLSRKLANLSVEKNGKVDWNDVKALLSKELGFWDTVEIGDQAEGELKKCYQEVFIKGHNVTEKSLYSVTGSMAKLAVKIMNDNAQIGWTTGSHSGIPVPVYAMGAHSADFVGKIDNTDIPKKIMKAAGVAF